MNRRIILGLLAVGLVVILSLGGIGVYKIQQIKIQAQNLLNAKLVEFATEFEKMGVGVKYKSFECSGVVFVECRNKEIAFEIPMLGGELLTFKNINIKGDDLDFKSLAFVINSDIVTPKIDGVEEYLQALFPHHLNLRIKLALKDETSYIGNSKIKLEAKNIVYQEEVNTTIASPELKEKGFFGSLQEFELRNDRIEVNNTLFSFTPKDLSEAIYQISKKKHGEWSREDFMGMAKFMIGASMLQFDGNAQMQEMIAGAGELVLGNAKEMKVYITPRNATNQAVESFGDSYERLFEKYNFKTELER